MHQLLATDTILALETAPELLELLIADAFPPGAPGTKGTVQHRTKDAINTHLLTRYVFPATEENRTPFKRVWENLERALGLPGLCASGMHSLAMMTVTRQQIRNAF